MSTPVAFLEIKRFLWHTYAVFLVNAKVYATDRPYKNALRVPLTGNTMERLKGTIDEAIGDEGYYREICAKAGVKYIGIDDVFVRFYHKGYTLALKIGDFIEDKIAEAIDNLTYELLLVEDRIEASKEGRTNL